MEDARRSCTKMYFHHFRPHAWESTAGAVYALAKAQHIQQRPAEKQDNHTASRTNSKSSLFPPHDEKARAAAHTFSAES